MTIPALASRLERWGRVLKRAVEREKSNGYQHLRAHIAQCSALDIEAAAHPITAYRNLGLNVGSFAVTMLGDRWSRKEDSLLYALSKRGYALNAIDATGQVPSILGVAWEVGSARTLEKSLPFALEQGLDPLVICRARGSLLSLSTGRKDQDEHVDPLIYTAVERALSQLDEAQKWTVMQRLKNSMHARHEHWWHTQAAKYLASSLSEAPLFSARRATRL